MNNNFLINGATYTCNAVNDETEVAISITLTIHGEEISLETIHPTDKKTKVSTYILSSKFQGNEIGKSEPFTMYALAKKSKSAKPVSPTCFVREFTDNKLILVLILKGIEYVGEMKKI